MRAGTINSKSTWLALRNTHVHEIAANFVVSDEKKLVGFL